MNDLRLFLPEEKADPPAVPPPPIGRLLVNSGKIAPGDLQHALGLQRRIDAPLGDIMISEGLVEKRDVLCALAEQANAEATDLNLQPPARDMASALPSALCLRFGVVPLREDQDALYVATASPGAFKALQNALGPEAKPLFPVIADEKQIRKQQSRLYGAELAEKASSRVPESESCRSWGEQTAQRLKWAAAALGAILTCAVLFPAWTLTVAVLWAVLTLAMTTFLKLAVLTVHAMRALPAGFFTPVATVRNFLPQFSAPPPPSAPEPELTLLSADRVDAALRITGTIRGMIGELPMINASDRKMRLPRVSVLVPLLREREIAAQLIDRLSRLTYPKSLLEVVLVLEESDSITRETIARTELPPWMSVIEVPASGDLTTKPRALNYALDFCRGSIIGVWDAEDWPDADQIEKVVTRFHAASDDVVCLQGVLDYYNARANWLSRCFTIEYAMWWRIVMPGIARLGLVVPLGGTTLFFKRTVLEELGGWDAHNVTEDADLGVRLARHGYRTELLPTVTREEATSRAWSWVRQRSRWLKGFLVTYFVHMRRPRALLRDLGFWRFMGLQTIFLAAVSQFAAAPLLWSFWLTLLGLTHPVTATLGDTAVWSLAAFFVLAEGLGLILGCIAVAGRDHRHLIPYVPTMMFYFTLGTIAAYKALWELVHVPFFWDKTQHGVTGQTERVPDKAFKKLQG